MLFKKIVPVYAENHTNSQMKIAGLAIDKAMVYSYH
jgi:hypothetical protein